MKQDAISYLSTEQENLEALSNAIFNLKEESYKEFETCNIICSFLEKRGFNVERNFQNISTAFKATFGTGQPQICLTCEYDAIKDKGHLTGHNSNVQIQTAAALGIAHVIKKIDNFGSVILLGCPGEYLGGSKETMLRQSAFENIDAVFGIIPSIITAPIESSAAVIPLKINFKSTYTLSLSNTCKFTSVDGTIMFCNILKALEKNFNCNGITIDYTICEDEKNPFVKANNSSIKLLIRSKNIPDAKHVQEKIENIAKYTANILCIETEIELYQPPSEPLAPNQTLNRILTNNLKENGITNIFEKVTISDGLSLGGISTKIPTISYLVSIIGDDKNIEYASEDFSKATLTPNANQICQKVAQSIFCTAIDLLEAPHLLDEAKAQLNNSKNILY